MQQLDFRAMGCQMTAIVDAETGDAARLLEQVPGWFEEWEQALSRFRPASELNHLNAASGEWTPVSDVISAVLADALWAAEWSEDIVVPTVLPALESVGYDRSFDRMARSQWGGFRPTSPAPTDWRAIEHDPARMAVRLPAGARLDLGGVAKGWAAEQAAARLAAAWPALVDAGGDVCVSGPRADGSPWPIGVADPLAPDQDIDVLDVQRGCVATSGRDYRVWRRNGKPMHHLIDPRTGLPAETDVLTATIVAPTARQAEAAAKAALILGSGAAIEWLNEHSLNGILFLGDGHVLRSEGIGAPIWS